MTDPTNPAFASELPAEWKFVGKPITRTFAIILGTVFGIALVGGMLWIMTEGGTRPLEQVPLVLWIFFGVTTFALVAVPISDGFRQRLVRHIRAYRPDAVVMSDVIPPSLKRIAAARNIPVPNTYARTAVMTVMPGALELWWGEGLEPSLVLDLTDAHLSAARYRKPSSNFDNNFLLIYFPESKKPVEFPIGNDPEKALAIWRLVTTRPD